jgi:hypothetical protein
MNTKRIVTTLALSLLATSCETPISDPLEALNDLVKPLGYIGLQTPLESTSPGTMLAGRPSAVSFVAPANDCFAEESIRRYSDYSNYSTVKKYTFQGSLGFLLGGNPILSAGLGLNKSVFVHVELSGLTTEYMSSIDITDWYQNGMSNTCKQYLNDVGFIIQALKADKLKITFAKKSGFAINLDADNISQYIGIQSGVDWSLEDNTTIVIDTPKYIGYQLGRLRLEDDSRSLWRAMTTKDDKYVFERIALFDPIEEEQGAQKSMVKNAQKVDNYSIYKK